jgi:hypothetical protein
MNKKSHPGWGGSGFLLLVSACGSYFENTFRAFPTANWFLIIRTASRIITTI